MLSRRPGISLKLSALVTLLIVAEMLLLSGLLDWLGPGYRAATLLAFVMGALSGGFLLAAGLDWLITRPLISLASQVRQLASRGFDVPIVPTGIDEPRELGEALERLRQQVVAHQDELRTLNRELEARVEARSTDLRRAQRQLVQAEKLASVGELAGGVAHEINNPTGIILARASYLCDMADDEGFDPDVMDDLEVIVHQAQRIQVVTRDLLSFARRGGSERAMVDLVDVSRLTINLLKHLARKAGVEIGIEEGEPIQVVGHRDGLEQVVFNLAKNALEATPSGGRVSIRLLHRDEGGAILQVDDSGPGVPVELRARIFDPFFTTKLIGQGTGLGLAVVYGIVTEHGGRIEVGSAPLGGARIQVLLPAGGDPDIESG